MKRISTIVMVLVILFPLVIHAQDAPEGIGGLRWGDSVEKFKELKNPSGFGLKEMKKDLYIGGRWVSLGDVTPGTKPSMYSFYQGKFCRFVFSIKEQENKKFDASKKFKILKESLVGKYGDPSKEIPSDKGLKYRWDFKTVWIELKWDDLSYEGSLSYSYMQILIEEFKADKQEEEKSIKKTKDDL